MKSRENYDELVKKPPKPSKKPPSTKLTKSEINYALIYLELHENVCIRYFETTEELKDIVISYTKSIGEYLSKSEQNENLIFSDKSVEKSNAKVGKDGQGLINLWKDLFQSFNMVTNDQAQAICAVYPSPLLLKKVFLFINRFREREKNRFIYFFFKLKAYENADRTGTGELLLADIQVDFCVNFFDKTKSG